MDRIPVMTRPRRRELVRIGRNSGDPATALRFLMIAKLAAPAGPSRSRVARDLGVACSTVIAAAGRFMAHGVEGLRDRRAFNGRGKVCAAFRVEVQRLLYATPPDFGWERPTWTRELFCLEMERRGFARVAVCTMGRLLSDLGARLGRPKPTVACPWPAADKAARLAELQRLVRLATAAEPVFYEDEVDIHLNPKIGADWMPRGFKREVLTPGKNVKRYMAGALDAVTGKLICVTAERKNSELFCLMLWRLAAAYRHCRRLHVIVDNYGIHSSKTTQRFLAQFRGRIVLHFLPPYCPDHNRIERVWLDLHANVTRNHQCPTIDVLMTNVGRFIKAYNRRDRLNPSHRRMSAAA